MPMLAALWDFDTVDTTVLWAYVYILKDNTYLYTVYLVCLHAKNSS